VRHHDPLSPVQDSGVGIAARAASRPRPLFQPFTRPTSPPPASFGGTGLGPDHSEQCLPKCSGAAITSAVPPPPGLGSTFDRCGGPASNNRPAPTAFPFTRDSEGSHLSQPRATAQSPPLRRRRLQPPCPRSGLSRAASSSPRTAPTTSALNHHTPPQGLGAHVPPSPRTARRAGRALAPWLLSRPGQPTHTFGMILHGQQMPELDGYGATAKRRLRRGSRTPPSSAPDRPPQWPSIVNCIRARLHRLPQPSPSDRDSCSTPGGKLPRVTGRPERKIPSPPNAPPPPPTHRTTQPPPPPNPGSHNPTLPPHQTPVLTHEASTPPRTRARASARRAHRRQNTRRRVPASVPYRPRGMAQRSRAKPRTTRRCASWFAIRWPAWPNARRTTLHRARSGPGS